jgi:hypothetical protein
MSRNTAITLGLSFTVASTVFALLVFFMQQGPQVRLTVASPAAWLDIVTGQFQLELAVLGTVGLVSWLVFGNGRRDRTRRRLRQRDSGQLPSDRSGE